MPSSLPCSPTFAVRLLSLHLVAECSKINPIGLKCSLVGDTYTYTGVGIQSHPKTEIVVTNTTLRLSQCRLNFHLCVCYTDQDILLKFMTHLINFPHVAPTNGQLRLVEGNYTSYSLSSGRLEVYLNGQWGTVCNHGWGRPETQVACQQLGYTSSIYGYTPIANIV